MRASWHPVKTIIEKMRYFMGCFVWVKDNSLLRWGKGGTFALISKEGYHPDDWRKVQRRGIAERQSVLKKWICGVIGNIFGTIPKAKGSSPFPSTSPPPRLLTMRKWAGHRIAKLTLPSGIRNSREFQTKHNMEPTSTVQRFIDALPSEDRAQLSDGFHSFEELYETRNALFVALCAAISAAYGEYIFSGNDFLWRSKRHPNGVELEGYFLAGINQESGRQISFHLPIEMWDDFPHNDILDKAPPFDGHTTKDVIERLKDL